LLVQVLFECFIILRAQLVDDILFHKIKNYHRSLPRASRVFASIRKYRRSINLPMIKYCRLHIEYLMGQFDRNGDIDLRGLIRKIASDFSSSDR
jgi:hypothetical protein